MAPNVVVATRCSCWLCARCLCVLALACNEPAPQGAPPLAPMPAQAQPSAAAPATWVTGPQPPISVAGAPAAQPAFVVPELLAGYQRFETAPIEVPAGASNDWAQWVGGPLDQDYDVIDVRGAQSAGGHHALIYAATEAQAPGYTRLWQDTDQITTRLMGGLGGEGGAMVHLPAGIVFRVQKGSYLLVQTHYLNATEHAISGRSVLDVKLAPVDRSRTVASILSSTSIDISLPPQSETVRDVHCTVQQDLRFLQISNHMHDYGVKTTTDFTDPAGVAHVVKDDPSWTGDLALNPNFASFAPDAPLLIPAGSDLHTRCTWMNTTAKPVQFPAEMCVFFGFILNDADIYCTDGRWAVQGAPSPAAPSGGAAGASPADTGSAGTAAARGCTSTADQAVLNAAAYDKQASDCALGCGISTDVAGCTQPCLVQTGLSNACAGCQADNIACGSKSCLSECIADSASDTCHACVKAHCDVAFHACTGL